MVTTLERAPLGAVYQGTTTPSASSGPVAGAERIETLDVLRGIALIGMFLVHFIRGAGEPTTAFGRAVVDANGSFFVNRFMTIFAILFGAGFAVQLSRTESRGDRFAVRFVRRLLALAVFGIIAEDLFGFSILLDYALWGFPLLLMRRWSNRAMIGAIFVFLLSNPLYWAGRAAYDVATGGSAKFHEDRTLCIPRYEVVLPSHVFGKQCADMRAAMRAATRARPSGYLATVRFRFARTWATYAHPSPWTYLPEDVLSLFLIGVLLLRMGVFQQPGEHRRLIVTGMLLGAGAWFANDRGFWDFMHSTAAMSLSLPLQVVGGFFLLPLLSVAWLAFVYIGAVLLLAAHSPKWLQRLRAFGVTGRMALTNYMLQVVIIDLTVRSGHGLHLRIKPEYAPLAALALFAFDVALSSWWLSRYRYGPLEWIWRSVTYWKVPALARSVPPDPILSS